MLSDPYQDVIRRRLIVPPHEGPDRTTTLEEAVRRHVPAGATVYLGAAHGRPNPAVRELVRQWWGKHPGFTLATVGLGSPWTALIHGGLVRRVVTTFMGEGYPFPTPQALISRAVLEGRLEVSNWSMLSFPLRLLAGAMGVPFLPTRSLLARRWRRTTRGPATSSRPTTRSVPRAAWPTCARWCPTWPCSTRGPPTGPAT